MIVVHNKKDTTLPVSPAEYIGRPSPLGNPFRIGEDGTRDEVIEKYDYWLCNHMLFHTPQYNELHRLANIYRKKNFLTLVCWCAPEACHGDIIRKRILDILGLTCEN